MKIIFKLFVISIGMVSILNLTGITPIPLLLSILLALLLFVRIYKLNKLAHKKILNIEDLSLVLFLIIVVISCLLGSMTKLNLNHLLAYFVVIVFYYFVVKHYLISSIRIGKDELYKVLGFSLLLTVLFGFLEFMLKNFLGIDLTQNYIPYSEPKMPATYMGIIRARSFMTEPTIYALYLNSFFPIFLTWIYNKKKYFKFYCVLAIYILALLTTFSAAGIGALLVSSFVVFLFYLCYEKKIKISIFLCCCIVLFALLFFFPELKYYSSGIVSKLSFDNPTSAGKRIDNWFWALDQITNTAKSFLFGYGVGYSSGLTGQGVNNWWLQVFLEMGVLGISAIGFLLVSIFYRVLKLNHCKYGVFISFLCVVMHYFAVSSFFYPFFWFLLILIQYEYYYKLYFIYINNKEN